MNIRDKKCSVAYIILLLCLYSCAGGLSLQQRDLRSKEDVIVFFIEIVSKRPGPLREARVVEVNYYDTIYRYHQEQRKDSLFSRTVNSWIQEGYYEGVSAVVFSSVSEDNPLLLISDLMPNKQVEVSRRLFVWKDGEDENDNLLKMLREKGLLLEREKESPEWWQFEYPLNETIPPVVFYFKSSSPHIYKRVVNPIAIGYYPPPSF